jgi:HK97 family phage prohead protease
MTATLSFGLELKQLSAREFEGYGSVFGNVDHGQDVVMRGAFGRSLAEHQAAGTLPLMFWMHQPDKVPGAWKDIQEDERGLYVKGELADTALGNEMQALLKLKAVRGLSIGYRTIEREYNDDGIRLLKEVELVEVSLVSLAMNPLAQVSAAKARLSDIGEYVPTAREFERSLRDAGYSRTVAKSLTSRLFSDELDGGMLSESLRDAGNVEDEDGAAELLKSLARLLDTVGAAAISRNIKR